MEYRGKFAKVKELAGFPVFKIFLSATLPPCMEEFFLEETSMPSSTLFIRAPTSRPNLRYHVLHVENEVKHINKVAVQLAHHLQQSTFAENSRGILGFRVSSKPLLSMRQLALKHNLPEEDLCFRPGVSSATCQVYIPWATAWESSSQLSDLLL